MSIILDGTNGITSAGSVNVDKLKDKDSTGAPDFPNGISATGDVSIADKIVHTGDTDTAIRFPADDTVTVETAGSERIRIDSAGNVGIGTSSLDQKLHISGGINYNGRIIERVGSRRRTGTFTLFTNGVSNTQSSGTVEVHAIFGTPSGAATWFYKISGNRNIHLVYSNTTGYGGSTPSVFWDGASLKVSNNNSSVFYSVCVRLFEIGNSWAPSWGDFPGISN